MKRSNALHKMQKSPDKILLAHGSGGKLSHELVENVFLPRFDNSSLAPLGDSAILDTVPRLAFTTDSYVVKPLFFPGGDIGRLAVCGTVNDLAVSGAEPFALSCAMILEEGMDLGEVDEIAGSMKRAGDEAGVEIVTGDTKVVERGGADRLFVTTAGIGALRRATQLSEERIAPGDRVIVNGTLGDHGIAVLAAREDLGLDTGLVSDCAPLNGLIARVLDASDNVKFMRDPTRGGLATTLNEISGRTGLGIQIEEIQIPLRDEVRSVCELLGLDPLYVANEGKVVIIVDADDVDVVLDAMRGDPLGRESALIGEVIDAQKGRVGLRTSVGGTRVVDMLTGDQLPRIC